MPILQNSTQLGLPDFDWHGGTHADLGAGRSPRNPLRCERVFAVDILDGSPFAQTEVLRYSRVRPGEPLPFPDDSLDCISAFDFLEHLPRYALRPDGTASNFFIDAMNEIWRTLKPGGLFIAVTPCYPAGGTFVDPTHVNPITAGTVDYFAGPAHARALGYGFHGTFETLATGWLPYGHGLWRTQEPLDRNTAPSSPLDETISWTRQFRQAVGKALRILHVLPRPEHMLWVLRKPELAS